MNFFSWLFNTKTGVVCLLVGGVLLFLIIAWALELRTRKEYFNHEKSENDWSLFDDDDDGND